MSGAIDAATGEFIARLRAFARSRVPTEQDAEDVVQDVLAKLVQRDDSVDPRSAQAWLFTAVRRAIIDRARARRHAEPLSAEPPGVEESLSALEELAGCVEPLLAAMPEEDRALLRRVDMSGESQAEIARELDLSPSGLKSRVQRARRRLRGIVDDCCALELDRRGIPVDFSRRRGGPCDCGGSDRRA